MDTDFEQRRNQGTKIKAKSGKARKRKQDVDTNGHELLNNECSTEGTNRGNEDLYTKARKSRAAAPLPPAPARVSTDFPAWPP